MKKCDTLRCNNEGVRFSNSAPGTALWQCNSCLPEELRVSPEPIAEEIASKSTLRVQVKEFTQEMERELKANDYRGGWQQARVQDLLHHLRHEVNELEEATMKAGKYAVLKRAVDVANFAMFIADNIAHLEQQSPNMCGKKHSFTFKQNSHLCLECGHFSNGDCHTLRS